MLVFLGIVVTVVFSNREKKQRVDIIMGEPTLPTISLLASGGEEKDQAFEVNELFGYKTQMETGYMRDTVTPISSSRSLVVKVRNYDNYVMGASFELRGQDTSRLVERTEIAKEAIVDEGEYTTIRMTFTNMLEADHEYFLTVCLHTDRAENIYYYTRIIQLTNNYCQDQIAFINRFSDAAFSKDSANIISFIEPDPSEDNTNFGHVNIKSSYSQITWGNLAPEKVTVPVINIKEILGDVGCYEMIYKVKALNDYNTEQYYKIKEFFRIKWTGNAMFLLDYDRQMSQIFDPINQNISNTRINLGICEDDQVEFMANEDNSYIAFAKKNGLWLMDIRHNQVFSLFSFEKPEDDDRRNGNTNSQVRVVSVDPDGNTEFVVYGYMNRGEHEGMTGVSLYGYDIKKNEVTEKIFIPFTRQYGMLKEMIGQMFYVNARDVMYIMLNEGVYSVDLTGSEYVQVIAGLKQGSYAVNEKGNLFAWENTENDGESRMIRILNLDDGTERRIEAKEHQYVKVIGFVGDDFAYGIARDTDIRTEINGRKTLMQNQIMIVDEEGNVLKEYSKEGSYFTDVSIEKNMITMSRYTKNGDDYEKTDSYQIFGNEEEESDLVSADIITTEKKKKEVVVNFAKKVTSSGALRNIYPNEIIFSDTNSLSIRELITGEERYYVYGEGEIRLITTDMAQAVKKAYDYSGVVINENGDYVWARMSRPEKHEILNINFEAGNALSLSKTDLSDTGLEMMYYFIARDVPVIAMTGKTDYVILAGYDFYNMILINPQTGERYKQGWEEAAKMFEQAGNKFMIPG